MLIHIGHEELAEMPNDRPTDTLVSDPLDDRLRLDVAQLFEWNFLCHIEQQPPEGSDSTHVFYALHVIHVLPFIVLPPRASLRSSEQPVAVHVVHVVVTLQEVRHTTPPSRTLAASTTLLAAISGSHLCLCRTSLGDGRSLEVLVIQAGIGVAVQSRIFCVVAASPSEKKQTAREGYILIELLAK